MISVFIDTFIILNLTAFSILTTGVLGNGKDGTELTQSAFTTVFGQYGDLFIAVCLLFFAFSPSWAGTSSPDQCEYLLGRKAVKVYSLLVVGFIILGSALKVDLVWELADFFNGLMVIPNVLALLALSGVVVKICKKFDRRR